VRNADCGEKITARPMKFRNSRTFPGQRYLISGSIVSGGISSICLPAHARGVEFREVADRFEIS